jgi:hypothetical protein
MRHLTSEHLIDLAEGVQPESSAPHLQSCETCRETLQELRATLSATASVRVPEPSPLFWDHFSARVRDAVEADRATATSAIGRWSWLSVSPIRVGTFAVVLLALVIAMRGGRPDVPVPVPEGSTGAVGESSAEAFSGGALPGGALPVGLMVAEDPSLSLVADLAADMDWDTASEAGFTTHVGVDNDAVADLTDSERRVLNQLLKGELSVQRGT